VNYKENLSLNGVFFVTPEEGWVSGDAATILHTTDGGQTWTAQLGGDPRSPEKGITMLRFLDQKHGWAVQGAKLLGTSDGENWEQVGIVPGPYSSMADYQFVSPKEGLALEGTSGSSTYLIYRTKDGGRTWKDVAACKVKVEIDGQTQEAGCGFIRLEFISPSVGYAVGGRAQCPDCGGPPVIGKTEDGGLSWRIFLGPGDAKTSTLDGGFFVDDRNGFVRVNQDRKLYATSDAGETWHALLASPGRDIRFADPEVGWSFEGARLSFTSDGGKRWSAREFRFPSNLRGFSFPRRDRAYIAGDHGMVYRYRVVPLDYTAKGMIDAPLMPTYGGPLLGHLQDMKTQVVALKAKLSAGGGAAASSTSYLARVMYGGGPDAEDSNDFSASTPQASQTTPAAGGFVQDTSTVPPSPFVQNCCAPQVQSMQSSFGSFSQEVPSFGSRFRSLNLILAGFNLASGLLGKRNQIGDAFAAFKKAPDAPAALAALQDLSGKLDSTHQAISMGFQNFSAGSGAGGVQGALRNAAADTLNSNAASTTQPGAPNADKAAQDAKKAAAELKKKWSL
jgi:photosystem II stability/assembly factor-like uncharacterized protein